MAKAKKTTAQQPAQAKAIEQKPTSETAVLTPADHTLRINLAIGTLTLSATILLLVILNNLIFNNYHPDIKAILDKVLPLSIRTIDSFFPEPVERMQFQASLLTAPFIVFGMFILFKRIRAFFTAQPNLAFVTNILGILSFFIYLSYLMKETLLYVKDQTMGYFFANNTMSINPLLGLFTIGIVTWLFFLQRNTADERIKKTIGNVVAWLISFLVIMDVVLYNIFHLAYQEWGRFMETNMIYYSITQVFAGKSLLVNVSAQYGLYAWVLGPLFKIIGLNTHSFGVVMAVLDGLSFLFVFLGIKRLLKNDLLSTMVFLAFAWWLYWESRLPFENTARYYYQYYPIRIIFPGLCFYLIVVLQSCKEQLKKFLLPLLALCASIGVLWNLDTGIVTFGAVTIALVASAYDPADMKKFLVRSAGHVAMMSIALFAVIAVFMLSTKAHSGTWPDFGKFIYFQSFYYVSGYFMLPMSALHFWNLPVIVYLITCIYCVYQLKKAQSWDTPVVVFLFILGAGIFSYFQGRSYDMNIEMVMYPAVILLGVFCNKLIPDIQFKKLNIKFNESLVLFLIVFFFFIDTAFSMLYTTPEIHSFAMNNAVQSDEKKDQLLKERINFVKSNLHKGDSVLILAQDYESYYYAAGAYVNPLDLPASTEWYFKSELNSVLNFIKTTKLPVIIDRTHVLMNDTITKTLAQYMHIEKSLPDKSMLLLKPGRNSSNNRLQEDAGTLYYYNSDDFSNARPPRQIDLPATFNIECYVRLDTTKPTKNNLIFTNAIDPNQHVGVFMVQNGPDPNTFIFTYGNGTDWVQGVPCKLSATVENHVQIKVANTEITVYNNNQLCGKIATGSPLRNSPGKFIVNNAFAGVVEELKVSR